MRKEGGEIKTALFFGCATYPHLFKHYSLILACFHAF